MDKLIKNLFVLEPLFRQNIESFGYHQVKDQDGKLKHEIITDSGYIPDKKRQAMEEMGITIKYRKRPWSERILGLGRQIVFTFADGNDPEVLENKRNVIMDTIGIRLPSSEFENIKDICRRPVIAGIRIGQRTVGLDSVLPDPELEEKLGFDDLDDHISSLKRPTV